MHPPDPLFGVFFWFGPRDILLVRVQLSRSAALWWRKMSRKTDLRRKPSAVMIFFEGVFLTSIFDSLFSISHSFSAALLSFRSSHRRPLISTSLHEVIAFAQAHYVSMYNSFCRSIPASKLDKQRGVPSTSTFSLFVDCSLTRFAKDACRGGENRKKIQGFTEFRRKSEMSDF